LTRAALPSYGVYGKRSASESTRGIGWKSLDTTIDNRIYECAEAAGADYIVTENAKHFKKPHKQTQIVNARQLLKLLAPGSKKA
jgi:hypothetical protein